ncbi:MAG TPA: bifunctional oligoribonuclease/PAP phosphatase NrnA [Geobacteraceae bacterium]|nr:bifunctional oligoribonuclease/PAP phosphatase NrnA [Geobacteraceae bacterium]
MITKIIHEIESNTSFLITTHEGPDGDAVGATLALASFLSELGKDVTVFYSDPLPDTFRFLPLADKVVNVLPDRVFDICFVLDAGDLKRAGEDICAFRKFDKIINIDHHPHGEQFGDLNYVDPSASATGAMIYRIIKKSGHPVDPATALCVYVAIVSDTGSFRYSNADSEAFQISAELVAMGINPWSVSEKLYESQPLQRLELLALALSTLSVSDNGEFASITVTLDMYQKTGTTAEFTDGFVNYPRSVEGVEVAAFFRETKTDVFKVGFRSKGKIDVSSLARAFGGGGHHNAAGCIVSGSLDEVKKTVFSYLEKAL